MKNKNIIIFLAILLVLVISVFVNASEISREKNLKNFGLCVSNSTKYKNLCYKEINQELKECAKQARNMSIKNKTLIKENLSKCKLSFKENKDECKKDFKISKENCLIYKNNNSANNLMNKKNETEKKCEDYTYSNCPDECGKKCMPSSCIKNLNPLNTICIDDCDGKGSCFTIPEKKCDEKLADVREELENIQKCESDSDCIIKGLNLPCAISQCESVFNKNSDLSKLKELSEDYRKQCQEICPMYACVDNNNLATSCINNKCQISDEGNSNNICGDGICTEDEKVVLCVEPGLYPNGTMISGGGCNQVCPQDCSSKKNGKKNYCTTEQREAKACIDLYEPVCGWFDYNKILCISYPCTGSIISQEFSNSCYACTNKDVLFWTKGKCPEKIKTSDISEKTKETDPVCGNEICEENEVAYPTGAPHLYYCPQDCK